MKRLYLLTLLTIGLAVGIFFLKKRTPTTIASGEGLVIPKAWLAANNHPKTPVQDRRPADQTFLTFPEWFLVFSPEEQANYYTHHTATTFPFMKHTAQIWQSYHIMHEQIKDNFPTNKGYHFMIWVIGTSASVEYAVKSWYECVVGRITDTGEPLTAEDQFNAKFTRDYVDFIKDRPWYEFDFKTPLKTLLSATPVFGSHWLRKIERRYMLTSELLVKYVYGQLIGMGSRQVYDVALPTTAVVLDHDRLQYLPRYDKFAPAAMELALQGHTFREIAGNTSAILLTVLMASDQKATVPNAQTVFTQPMASDPDRQRVALAVPVAQLHTLLLQLNRDHMTVEHVFDY